MLSNHKSILISKASAINLVSDNSSSLACMLQVYDLLVACGWMAGSHTSAPSAPAHRIDGQPPPGSIVKCDPLEAQMHPVFSSSLQAFPGFHPGPFQI